MLSVLGIQKRLNVQSRYNGIPLIFKRYIWISKFKGCNLSLDGFMGFLKSYVIDLKYIFEIKKEAPIKLLAWNTIISALNV